MYRSQRCETFQQNLTDHVRHASECKEEVCEMLFRRWYDDICANCCRKHLRDKPSVKNAPLFAYFLRRIIWKTACDRDEWLLANVMPDVRTTFPCWINFNTSSTQLISVSLRPITWTCWRPSSSTRSLCLLLRRSNTWDASQWQQEAARAHDVWENAQYACYKEKCLPIRDPKLVRQEKPTKKVKKKNFLVLKRWQQFLLPAWKERLKFMARNHLLWCSSFPVQDCND